MAEAALVDIGKELAVDAAKALAQLVAARAYDEVNHAWGLKDQLRKLTRKLEYIQAFLEDASIKKHVQKSHLLDLWLKKVKDVSYMSDDVLDEYAIEMFRRKMELKNRCNKFRNLFTLSNPVFFRFRMSQQVNDVLSRFDELESEARSIGLSQVQIATSTVPDIRFDDDLLTLEETRKYGAASASDFIGREDDMNKLLQMLCHSSNDDHDLTTIAIVGMGGLGKTSLAKRLYDDEKISEHFGNKKFWICVSENFNITRLLNEMVESATSIKGDLSNMDAITRKLQTFLEGKKFLLVLDDVWNDNQLSWNSLKTTLQSTGRLLGSVILITTRSEDVAKAAGAISIHKLEGLSPEDSWDLFKLKVHMPEAQPNVYNLEDIGRRIVTRCRGVPLSLTVIAGVLRLKHSLEEWEEIDKSELWELPQGRNQILPSLFLSFKHLPSPSLKQCFAYCAIFRKDQSIAKQELVALWLAQGFLRTPISRTRRMTMEEIGDEYIKVLINNSLLQEDENDSDSCKMHDLVHDLAVHVSQDVMLIKEGEEQRDNFGYRHLAYFSHENVSTSDFPTLENLRKVRTIYGGGSTEHWLIYARNLRSLDLSLAGITEVPLAIGSLKHLRFLDLSLNPIRMLPDFIGKLYQLHTLALQDCKQMTRLPAALNKLVNLRFILTTTPMFASKGLANLKNLQTLPYLALNVEREGWTVDELGDLHELRGEICIDGLDKVQGKEIAKRAGLGLKNKVTKLILNWAKKRASGSDNTMDEDILDGFQPHPYISHMQLKNFYGESFPTWVLKMAVLHGEHCGDLKPLNNLTAVKLLNCNRCKTLPTLGHLPFLRSLVLSGFEVECIDSKFYATDDVISKHENSSSSGNISAQLHLPTVKAFESLKELEVSGFQKLTTWMVPPQQVVSAVFPCLQALQVKECPKLEKMPVVDLESLKSLELRELHSIESLDIIKVTTSLTSLVMWKMPVVTSLPDELANCTKLRSLKLIYLKNLRYLPTGVQSLISLQTLHISSEALTSLPDDIFQGFSSLRDILIFGCPNVTRMPTSLEGCTSLEKLVIRKCGLEEDVPAEHLSKFKRLSTLGITCRSVEYMRSMLDAVQYLPLLGELGIEGFRDEEEMREYFSDMTPFLRLPSLKRINLIGSPYIKYLPELQLDLLSGLDYLSIWEFPDLEEIPVWICNLTSLVRLHIGNCFDLKKLPAKQDLQRLTRLRKLYIFRCPLLAKRCDKDDGPEWPKIEHIKYIEIDLEEVY